MKQKIIKRNNKSSDDIERASQKKPFDKKKYRLQKYSNKYKVKQWEEGRRKSMLRQLYKEVAKEHPKTKQTFVKESTSESTERSGEKKISAFHIAKREYLKKKQEKEEKKEAMLKAAAEKEEALRKYKEQKMQKYKKLSQKTKKGQPVMKGRMELLLEKIQKDVTT